MKWRRLFFFWHFSVEKLHDFLCLVVSFEDIGGGMLFGGVCVQWMMTGSTVFAHWSFTVLVRDYVFSGVTVERGGE